MNRLIIHPRIEERHPELDESDVVCAWNNAFLSTTRTKKNPNQYLAIGADSKGRMLEMVAVLTENGDWLVFHAMTPPSDNTLDELHLGRG